MAPKGIKTYDFLFNYCLISRISFYPLHPLFPCAIAF